MKWGSGFRKAHKLGDSRRLLVSAVFLVEQISLCKMRSFSFWFFGLLNFNGVNTMWNRTMSFYEQWKITGFGSGHALARICRVHFPKHMQSHVTRCRDTCKAKYTRTHARVHAQTRTHTYTHAQHWRAVASSAVLLKNSPMELAVIWGATEMQQVKCSNRNEVTKKCSAWNVNM